MSLLCTETTNDLFKVIWMTNKPTEILEPKSPWLRFSTVLVGSKN